MEYDVVIVGCGLSGVVAAREFVDKGKRVLIIEKRNHVGGNVFDFYKNDILVHKYGPHIFHTNNEIAYQFLSRFTKLNDFKNEVTGLVRGRIIPIPFNFDGIDAFWPEKKEMLKEKLIEKYGIDKRIFIQELRRSDDSDLKMIGEFVYKNIFENYTMKMWGVSADKIDPEVIKRVPITIGYGKRYFSDKYEGLPINGYTEFIKSVLKTPKIKVLLKTDSKKLITFENNKIKLDGQPFKGILVYTGPIDEMLDYKYGVLDYRSLNIVFDSENISSFQDSAVVNYPQHKKMTRITEYKKMTNQVHPDKTVLSWEFPGQFNQEAFEFSERYYPMMTKDAKKSYLKYYNDAKKIKNLHLLGRLATYKYINMDQSIVTAIELVKSLVKNV